MTRGIYAMVPARAGSVGLPNKNIRLLNGKPLILHSLLPAMASDLVEETYLNSDSDEYLRIAAEAGAKTYRRPDRLGKATTTMQEVVADFVRHLKSAGKPVKAVLVLYPTYPFRTPENLKDILDFYHAETDCDSIIGMKQPTLHPYLCATLDGENRISTFVEYDVNQYYRRQDYPECYQFSAWAMVANADHVDELNAQMMSPKSRGYRIAPDIRVVDIDAKEDFQFAEYLIDRGIVKPGC
ncbi:cytidylyltransferase domain-containing protein [Roseibium litorale]|uniref:Acylneuraminate cytidylyltransferase family protein n=1 Tax=Roseibium litorale TaxID=2803841 RepID=A0ABR9CQZ1_9HYPH|nr:acylneuraminate cytidylyltransferase family protein [Roseibium litorale]MBD8892825.1 acylneuraminate cytidylyltransferase family protein [Roseibium litorale]